MTRKQLQALISAGVFSAALLSGSAYADETSANANTNANTATAPAGASQPANPTTPPAYGNDQAAQEGTSDTTSTPDPKKKTSGKDAAQNGCAAAGGCGSK